MYLHLLIVARFYQRRGFVLSQSYSLLNIGQYGTIIYPYHGLIYAIMQGQGYLKTLMLTDHVPEKLACEQGCVDADYDV